MNGLRIFFLIGTIYLGDTKRYWPLGVTTVYQFLRTGTFFKLQLNFNLLTLHNQTKSVNNVVTPYPRIPVTAEITITVASSLCIVDISEGLLVLVRRVLCDMNTRDSIGGATCPVRMT